MYLVDLEFGKEPKKIILLGLNLLGYVSHWVQFFKDSHLYDLKKGENAGNSGSRYSYNCISFIRVLFSKSKRGTNPKKNTQF